MEDKIDKELTEIMNKFAEELEEFGKKHKINIRMFSGIKQNDDSWNMGTANYEVDK